MDAIRHRLGSFVIALATALAIVAIAIPLFLNPIWVSFEQGRAEAPAWTGFTVDELRAATDEILADLVVGPPEFDVTVNGVEVLNERERSHMRDVRSVFMGFFVVTGILVAVAVAAVVSRGREGRAGSWASVRSGALGLILGLVLLGGFALVAFDVLFEVFHQVFFPGGSYTFDPATERLVQLFPFRFWEETAIALGAVAIAMAVVVAAVAHRRSERAARSTGPAAAPIGEAVAGAPEAPG